MGKFMIQKMMSVGMLESNCYILGDEVSREAVVIDPGGDGPDILAVIQKENLKIKTIINTHGHFDHVGANQALKDASGAPIAIHQSDAAMLSQPSAEALFFTGGRLQPSHAEILLQEDDILEFGPFQLKVLHTPGHTVGGICLVLQNEPIVYVGDTLFAGSIGRTDFPGGSFEDLIASVKTKIFTLGDNYLVMPGHGPATTVGQERQYNPFF
jgi:hydroxyacylglutathione hydrolase